MAKYNADGSNDYGWQARINSAPSGSDIKRERDAQNRAKNSEPLNGWAAYGAGLVSGIIISIFIISMGV